jgi:hypothetical protein
VTHRTGLELTAVVSALSVCLFGSATAAAQPPPGPLPAPPNPFAFESIPGLGPISAPAQMPPPGQGVVPPPATALFPLAQSGSPTQLFGGLPAMPDLSGQTANEFVLGQHAAPAAPGTASAAPAHMNPFNNAYLLPQYLVPSAPGDSQLFGIAPGQENADVNGIDYLKRLYDSYKAGGLEGGLLGQRELDSLNKPLPVEPPAPLPTPRP